MKLASGTHLGPYAIEHPLGAGGMGVVYRADDSRLGRKVAIKILPGTSKEHFRRFEREARTIGSLNHPNLLTLYDVGDYDGTPFLVTELLEGEPLRARMQRGQLKLRETIQIAADVARGLAAAHEAGIVHRDIKPDNIFLTRGGLTKILDFGIAKLRRSMEMPAVVDPTEPTQTPTTMDTGLIIGTPGYMAPEQLDGGTIDVRTDIFALGVVLYEMICGRRAFAADNPVEESYAILKTTPDPPQGATKALARVVMRCLEKRKDARFQSATDLAFALDELDASTDPIAKISRVAIDRESQVTIRDPSPPVPVVPWTRYAVIACVAIVLALGGVLVGRMTARSHGTTSWPTFADGGPRYQRVTYHAQSKWCARLAPDGANVLYSVPRGDRDEVVRSQTTVPTILPTGIVGRLLDVSAHGELAVVTDERPGAGGTLARVTEGAGPRAVLDGVTAAAWVGDDLAVVRSELVIEAPIGTPIVRRTSGALDDLRVSPNTKLLAFADHPASGDNAGRVVIVDRTGKQVAASAHQVALEGIAWSPDGNEVWFANTGTLYALDLHGKQRVVLRGPGRVYLLDVRGGKVLVAPSDLRLKLFTGPLAGPHREIGWFDGSEVEAVSADGKVVGFIESIGTLQNDDGYAQYIRRAPPDHTGPDEPATLIGHGGRFTLLPDASAVIAANPTSLVRISTGVGTPAPIPLGKVAQIDPSDRVAVSWSGRHVVVRGAEAGAPLRLWRIDLETKGTPEPIESSYTTGRHPISPDGQLVAIPHAAGGIELVPFPRGDVRTIAGPVAEEPLSFSGDGASLFVMHLTGGTIEVDRITLATGKRESWTRITPEQRPVYHSVVLDADGGSVTYSTNSDASDLYVLQP